MIHHIANNAEEDGLSNPSYFPIFLIFGYIAGVTLLVQISAGAFDWMIWMRHFMAGFFLVFSFFKIMNLRGFAEGYSTYDILPGRYLCGVLFIPLLN